MAYTTYQSDTIEKVQKFLDKRINASVRTFSDEVWMHKCDPDIN